jgi:hypothetical protein
MGKQEIYPMRDMFTEEPTKHLFSGSILARNEERCKKTF